MMGSLMELARTNNTVVGPGTSSWEAAKLLEENGSPGLVVVDGGRVLGVVKRSDVFSGPPDRPLGECPLSNGVCLEDGSGGPADALAIMRREGLLFGPLVNMDGSCLGLVCRSDLEQSLGGEDGVSGRESANVAREDSEELFRLLFDNVNSGILLSDSEGRLLAANSHALSLTGLGEGVSGKRFEETMPEAKALLSRKSLGVRRRVNIRNRAGKDLAIGYTNVELDLPTGKGLITLFKDIGQLQLEEERRKRDEQLAQVGELAAKLSHEIKNPLSSIMAGLQLLNDSLYLRSEDNEVLQTIIEEVKNVGRMVSAILDTARLEPVAPRLSNLSSLLQDAADLFRTFARKNGIDLTVDPHDPEVDAYLDKRAFGRVLNNIVANAIDAVERDGWVEIASSPLDPWEVASLFPGFKGDVVRVTVADNGPGIDPDRLGQIFNAFYTTKESGTGLGLAVAREVVEFHGGAIVAGNRPGGGAIFSIFLPAVALDSCKNCQARHTPECEDCPTGRPGWSELCWTARAGENGRGGLEYNEKCLECEAFMASNLSRFFRRSA